MRRRDFVTWLGGALFAWPWSTTIAQQEEKHLIGFLFTGSSQESAVQRTAFLEGLKELGFIEGRNIEVDYRYAENVYDRLPGQAADLVGRRVAVIAAIGASPSALAAKQATSTIPIVFGGGADPLKLGLVTSLNHPGGNATGVVSVSTDLEVKRFDILCDLIPSASSIVFLVNPSNPNAERTIKDLQAAATRKSAKINVVYASTTSEIDSAFVAIKQLGAKALLLQSDAFFVNKDAQVISLAASHAIPTSYAFRRSVVAGGLVSYGADLREQYRQVGIYVGQILKGAKPGDLPVIQPTKFELVLNLKTARKLGLTIPRDFLLRLDEVIE